MPAIPEFASGLANDIVHRATLASPPNVTGVVPVLEVVCAWPVSGQYGPGTRVLYVLHRDMAVLSTFTDTVADTMS